MAFTITRQPYEYTTAFNDITFDVISTNVAQPQYKYIFKTYVNDVLVSTSKLYPRPVTNNCIFDVQPIVKNYIGGKRLLDSATASVGNAGYVAETYVDFYEEFMSGSTLYTSNILATSNKISAFEMVSEYNKQTTENYMKLYTPSLGFQTAVNEKSATLCGRRVTCYLSWSPTYTKDIKVNDTYEINMKEYRWITLISRNLTKTYYAKTMTIRTYTNTGQVKLFTYTLPNVASSTNKYYNMLHIPVGPLSLNAWTPTSTSIPSGLTSSIVDTEDIAYAVEILDTKGAYIHQSIMFRIVPECSYDYEHITAMYKTPGGGWWYIPFNLKHYYTENNERTLYEKKRQYNSPTYFQARNVINMEGKGTYTLNTNWLPTQYHVLEIQDLLQSTEVYLIRNNTDYTPVVVKTSEYQIKTISQDKLTQYTIEFEEAFNKNYLI